MVPTPRTVVESPLGMLVCPACSHDGLVLLMSSDEEDLYIICPVCPMVATVTEDGDLNEYDLNLEDLCEEVPTTLRLNKLKEGRES